MHPAGALALGPDEWIVGSEHEFIVRPMHSRDLKTCTAIEEQCFPEAVREGLGCFERELSHHAGSCWVSVEIRNGEVVGYIVSMPVRQRDCPIELDARHPPPGPTDSDGDRTLYLHDLSVAPRARRKGVGEGLLQRALAFADSRRLPSITLTAVCGAAGYWRRQGFVEVSELSADALGRLRSYPPECGDILLMHLEGRFSRVTDLHRSRT
jgi:ribosomal protein S18 acetylase RimI-like enzyme